MTFFKSQAAWPGKESNSHYVIAISCLIYLFKCKIQMFSCILHPLNISCHLFEAAIKDQCNRKTFDQWKKTCTRWCEIRSLR